MGVIESALRTGQYLARRFTSRISVLILILLGGYESASAELIRDFRVASWTGGAYSRNGAFSHCAASAAYKSGVSVLFSINKDLAWSLGFVRPTWDYTVGKPIEIVFTVDNMPSMTARGAAITSKAVEIPLRDSAQLFNLFKTGKVLRVGGTTRDFEFNLTNTSQLLDYLLACAASKGRPPATVEAGVRPSQPSSTASATPPSRSAPKFSTGTGFFVADNGHLVTNHHVIDGCEKIAVSDHGKATVVARDRQNDLALLKVDAKSGAFVKFRSTVIRLGEKVFVLGFPFAGTLDNGLNITDGMVSSLAGIQNDTRYVQVTAPVQPGNSGGPMVDNSGNLVGVITARLNDVAMLKESGAIPQNVNFSLRSDFVANFIRVHGVEPAVSSDTTTKQASDIADGGKKHTVQIVCMKS